MITGKQATAARQRAGFYYNHKYVSCPERSPPCGGVVWCGLAISLLHGQKELFRSSSDSVRALIAREEEVVMNQPARPEISQPERMIVYKNYYNDVVEWGFFSAEGETLFESNSPIKRKS